MNRQSSMRQEAEQQRKQRQMVTYGLIIVALAVLGGGFWYANRPTTEERVISAIQAYHDAKETGEPAQIENTKQDIIDLGPTALEYIIAYFSTENRLWQAELATIVAEMGNVAVGPLTQGLHSKDDMIRLGCAKALDYIGTDNAISFLEAHLPRETNQDIKYYVAEIIHRKSRSTGQEYLLDEFWRSDQKEREKIISMLATSRKPELVPFFKRAYLLNHTEMIQLNAVRAIGVSGSDEELPFLRNVLRDHYNWKIRREAAIAIEKISGVKTRYRVHKDSYKYPDEY